MFISGSKMEEKKNNSSFVEVYMYYYFVFVEEKMEDNKLLDELVVVHTFKHERHLIYYRLYYFHKCHITL